ncbi:Uncharacterised protein [Klebsiella pneumoniae]|nr:Uncharacterised protein [Klebsiella pneumoniae]
MQADAIVLLLFPGVKGHLLHQFWHRELADFRRPAIALDRFDCQFRRQFRRFFMLQRFFQRLWRRHFFFYGFNNRR